MDVVHMPLSVCLCLAVTRSQALIHANRSQQMFKNLNLTHGIVFQLLWQLVSNKDIINLATILYLIVSLNRSHFPGWLVMNEWRVDAIYIDHYWISLFLNIHSSGVCMCV